MATIRTVIYERKNKKTFGYKVFLDGKLHKTCELKTFNRKVRAKEHMEKYLIQLEKEINKPTEEYKDITFDELYEMFKKYKETGKSKDSTIREYKEIYNNQIKDIWGSRKVSATTLLQIDEFQHHLLTMTYKERRKLSEEEIKNGYIKKDLPYSNGEIKKYQHFFNSMLKFAKSRNIIDSNPFELTEVKEKVGSQLIHEMKNKKPPTILTKEEFSRFINYVDDPVERAFYLTSYFTGARPGEALSIEVQSYDRDNKAVHIITNWDHVAKIQTTTKNKKIRLCPLPKVAYEAIEYLLDTYYPKELISADSPLFGLTRHLSKTTLDNHRRDLCKKHAVPWFTLQDLRKTNISMLLVAGMNEQAIIERTGHTVEEMKDTYAHVTKLLQKQNEEIIDKVGNQLSKLMI